MGIAAFEKIPILIMLMVGLTSICGFVADSIGKIFPIRSIEAVELTTDLVKLSRNSRLVSPCLKILSVKTKTSVAKSELAALAEVLAVPLYRMGEEEAKALSTTQLRALEKLVFDETSLELTISGLLVLGNAEFAVEQESTVRSWAQCPDRRGAAAREYLQAQGEMVGWGG